MVACKDQCEDPVCPPDGPCHEAPAHQDHHNQKCKACSYTNEDKNKLYNHEKSHYVRKCEHCKLFIKDKRSILHSIKCYMHNIYINIIIELIIKLKSKSFFSSHIIKLVQDKEPTGQGVM